MSTVNFNSLFNNFAKLILEIINKHVPLKQAFRRQKRLSSKPWISKGILISLRKRRLTFKSHFLLGNSVKKPYFGEYSNKLTKIVFLAKKLYFADSFDKTKNDPKNMGNTRSPLPNKRNNPSSFKSLIDTKTKSDDSFDRNKLF